MKLKALHKSSHIDPYPHERLTRAGDLNRSWGRAVYTGRLAPLVYPVLDRELIREAACAFGSSFKRADETEAIAVFTPQLHKRNLKHGFAPSLFNCYWPVDQITHAKYDSVTINRSTSERTRLERAAKTGNEAAFLAILKHSTWENKSASDYARLVDLALEAGAHVAARQIAAKGVARYPDNPRLQKQATILAPPRVVEKTKTARPAHRANRDWLKANSEAYRGKWVALRDGELLATANSIKELTQQVGRDKSVLLTIV